MPFFRVATEGATTDGRIISRDWITQMAGNYDPKKYGARVWMEHMRGMFHDGPFPALGDIKALKAEEVEDGKLGPVRGYRPNRQAQADQRRTTEGLHQHRGRPRLRRQW